MLEIGFYSDLTKSNGAAFQRNVASWYGVGKQKSVTNGDSGLLAKAKERSPSSTTLISNIPQIRPNL